ncbi:hypothetical protein [Mycolicibacterium hippocampi]|uniref:Uncharacterized protein n=1 Tax=Mycolicibacterium hippocampi TaxID=659824 RepID=A0A7I9ZJU2_9MYCO|nr:hypothetical protein [Mycolicibacterium hippocampi]GFH00977.1 hypothetical protein MHIP_14600 [Mycolicibacterium hippocampi]
MQILASALPGFRDLRAPLIAGYLWLLCLWTLVKPNIAVRPANDIAASIYDLAVATGPIWIGLAVSVGAYLVGSVSQILSPVVRLVTRRTVNRAARLLGGALYALYAAAQLGWARVRHGIRQRSVSAIGKLTIATDFQPSLAAKALSLRLIPPPPKWSDNPALTRHRFAADEKLRKLEKSAPAGWVSEHNIEELRNELSDRYQRAADQLRDEMSLPATLLVGENPALFSEADRLKAEGELRLALVPPIAAITVLLSISHTPIWLCLFVALIIIAAQGLDREHKFQTLMDGALRQGQIIAQSIEEFKSWVDTIPAE